MSGVELGDGRAGGALGPGRGVAAPDIGRAVRAACLVLASYLAAIWAVLFSRLTQQVYQGGSDVLAGVEPSDLLVAAAVAVPVLVLLAAVTSRRAARLRFWLFRLRVPLGVIAVVALTMLEVSGSSVAQWSTLIGGEPNQGTLLGFSRSVRGDEFNVMTPFAFSQEYTGYAAVSDLIRATSTDVTMVYAQPCWAIATLFRPFLWGYLFLRSARGLAFFWSARLVVLLLVSFELGRLVTRDRRGVALAYAVALTFCPLVQWWFAINGIAGLFIFGQALVLVLHRCLRADGALTRVLHVALMTWLALGYIFVIYPAWQVPLFWIFLALGAGDVIDYVRDVDRAQRGGIVVRRVVVPVACVLLASAVVTLACLIPVLDVVRAVTGTVYPGQRTDLGGGGLPYFLYEASSLMSALRAGEAPLNACESAGVFALFPLGFVAAAALLARLARRTRKLDVTSVALMAAEAVLVLYCLVGLPELLGTVTLLSHSLNVRVAQIVGFADLLLGVRAVALWGGPAGLPAVAPGAAAGAHFRTEGVVREPAPRAASAPRKLPWPVLLALDAAAGAALGATSALCAGLAPELAVLLALIALCLLVAAQLAARGEDDGGALVAASLVVLLAGASVNPVQVGADALIKNPSRAAIAQVAESDPEALWASEYSFLGQLCITAGAPCVNSVNTYPALERWRQVDTGASDERAYNRYAHISVVPTTAPTSFERGEWDPPDTFTVRLSLADMARMGVRYYASLAQELPDAQGSVDGWRLELLRRDGAVTIWQLVRE